jgi:SAM-dependent methyltransferase
VLLDEHGPEPPHRRVPRDADPVDTAADDEDVGRRRGELFQGRPLVPALRGSAVPLNPDVIPRVPRPSTWFVWHAHLIRPGARVLDLACGAGRHSLAAAALGASVVAVDKDAARLASAKARAEEGGVAIEWCSTDLADGPWPAFGRFDVVLVFNYLDRARVPEIVDLVAPHGVLIMESFLELQRELGWGPGSPEHLLREGELARLVRPLKVLFGREVLEPVDAERWRAVASVVAGPG